MGGAKNAKRFSYYARPADKGINNQSGGLNKIQQINPGYKLTKSVGKQWTSVSRLLLVNWVQNYWTVLLQMLDSEPVEGIEGKAVGVGF